MVRLLRHRQTKGPVSARLHLNCRATPRLHLAGNRSPFPFFSMASTADFANKGSQQELFHEFRLRTIDCAAKVTDAIVASYPKFRGLFDTIHTALPGPSMFNGSVGLAHAEAAYDS